MRLAVMDRAGIERCVLSLAGPGVQAERDTKTACRRAREANDFLAREIAKRPDRYSGFAHLADAGRPPPPRTSSSARCAT